MSDTELPGDSFLIIGYGREGRSAHRYLSQRFPRARIAVADRSEVSLESGATAEVFTGANYLESARSFHTIIRSPGVSIRDIKPYLHASSSLTSATNIFFTECPGKIVGITGTKGKSTTSSLTASILSKAFPDVRLVGNIGTPMLDLLESATPDTIFVVELSSYQLEDLRRSPTVSILLNIVPEHLDYHGGFENYRDAKLNIARHQSSSDTVIFNEANKLLSDHTRLFKGTRRNFREVSSDSALVAVRDGMIVIQGNTAPAPLLPISEVPLLGPGNLQNALAAITCGVAMGATANQIHEGLISFKPLEHRLELVAQRCGITFYNDSLSTIPEALAHALEALGDRVDTVIAGGFDRGVDMTPVGPALAASKVRNLILFPTTGAKIWEAAQKASAGREYTRVEVETMEDAVQAAYDLSLPGSVCVMSPASSSFSVFRDYKERGDKFKEAVRRLSPKSSNESFPTGP